MEPTSNKVTLVKPSAFITSLQKNSALTLAAISRLQPVALEVAADLHRKYADTLDGLHRSLNFFSNEYVGQGKEKYIAGINTEIEKVSGLLAQTPKPVTIGELSRTNFNALEKCLKLLINDLRLFFQVEHVISTEGITSLVPLIIGEYPMLYPEEIAICFAQAKKGYFGELYNRLDGAIILKWLKLYHAEKLLRINERNYTEHAQAKIGAEPNRPDRNASHDDLVRQAYAAIEINNIK